MSSSKQNIAQRVAELVKPITDSLGLFLWDVRFEKEGASWFLRIILDADDQITMDDCEAVSRPLSELLDQHDFIEQSYCLEVSSPGLMRQLRTPEHFQLCLGESILIKRIRPDEKGQREYGGILRCHHDGVITLENAEGQLTIPLEACAFIKLDDDCSV